MTHFPLLVRIKNRIFNLDQIRYAIWIDKGDKVPMGEFSIASDDMLKLIFQGGWTTVAKGDEARGIMALLCDSCQLQFGADVSLMSDTMRPETTTEFFFGSE